MYPLWKMQGLMLIAMWSFILKTLRNIHGRWTLDRLLPAARDYVECGSPDQVLEASVEGVRCFCD